jgi:radical SAM superfamily enzyme YgiQ (UPF0313 family)
MAALVRSIHPGLGVFFVVPFRATSISNRLKSKPYSYEDDPEIDAVAAHMAKWDMVCLSSMSTHAAYAQSLIRAIRKKNPGTFIVWGGIHATVSPEDAILHADAVCVGEGEKAFAEFLELFRAGRDYTGVRNFHFKINGRVIKNALLPLQTAEELGALPYPLLNEGEFLYKNKRGFTALRPLDYVRHEGLAYNTVWSIGCPNRCVYCGNSTFLKHHIDYGRLRFPSVDHMLGDVAHARRRYPHLSSVTFHDDMFMAIPLPTLEEFAEKWRDRIALPFAVHGLMSRYVDPRRMKTLISAGMFRVRMGIQSGSPRTLKFFRRQDSCESIEKAVGVIHRFSKFMMAPSYDLIVDNPMEGEEDIAATVRLLHRMPRPYILNAFPLMVIGGTKLAEIAQERNLDLPSIKQGHPSSSYANALILSVCLLRIPRLAFEFLLKRMAWPGATASAYPMTGRLLRSCLAIKRSLAHLRFGHCSVIPSRIAWILWKIGFVGSAHRTILHRCKSVVSEPLLDEARVVKR